MKSILSFVAWFGIAAAIGAPDARTARTPFATACHAADSYSAYQIAALVSITGGTDAKSVAWRQQVSLPAASPSAITLVSDSTVCAQALTALNQTADYDDGPATDLYLISVGSTFVASNPKFPDGEWTEQFVFDSTFTYKASYMK
jgi:hypothetical protein